MREIGGLLDATAVHPRRSARNHLLAMAATHRIPARRVDEVLNAVRLTDVAGRLAGTLTGDEPAARHRGRAAEQVGDLAYQTGVRLHELRSVETSLEQAYMDLTAGSVEYTETTR
jgi:hypothetical protein